MTVFPQIEKIPYEGPETDNPLAFRWYDENREIEGKTMRDHLRFSVVYWHTFRNNGADPFGMPTLQRPWDDGSDSLDNAKRRLDVAFEFMSKLGVPYFAFHDRDVAPEGESLKEANQNLDEIANLILQHQSSTGIKLLWGTANLFSHPRYMHGAATSCNADVFAYAAAQVKKAIEITQQLGGENYVFWGGREGYQNLWNTNDSHYQKNQNNLRNLRNLRIRNESKTTFPESYKSTNPRPSAGHDSPPDALFPKHLPERHLGPGVFRTLPA